PPELPLVLVQLGSGGGRDRCSQPSESGLLTPAQRCWLPRCSGAALPAGFPPPDRSPQSTGALLPLHFLLGSLRAAASSISFLSSARRESIAAAKGNVLINNGLHQRSRVKAVCRQGQCVG